MAWTYTPRVPTETAAPDAAFGWGPLAAFHYLLAAEEGIDLSQMHDFGGYRPWDSVETPMRLLFDLDYINGDHPTSSYPAVATRLREIHGRWSTGTFAGDSPRFDGWRQYLTVRLKQLAHVVDECIRIDTRIAVR
ncbi:hypothetical protein GA0070622_6307 [Micromonospora sediminicola]|uniref:Uncharacterized protein n=1 Tax=Micromonospora sediminicola TaxID=946078 RepID=A0A1A9BJ18_9ACTN|nr:hypothetical protein [Micromonospora sediminicola]SBT69188.1 hypothetical protein GA0070622_6307 [Micromonospora sediminicola]